MAKKSQLEQFGLKRCTVVLRKLSESEIESTQYGLSCHRCQKKFNNKKSVVRHVKYCLLVKQHKCEVCDKTFRTRHEIELHSLVHKDKTEYPFPCSYCPKRYRSKFKLQDHVRSHLNEKPFPCVQCGNAYSSQAGLREHINNFHNVNRGSFACDKCNRIYVNLKSLQVHRKNIHENPTVHKCKVCGKGFPRKCALICHSKIHDPDAKMFSCGFCVSRFLHRATLARHMKTHTKEKVKCNLCNKQLSAEASLKNHVRIIHCNAELANTFPCPEKNCTKKYATSTQLKQHIKKHLDYELWPLQCNFCNKRFLRFDTLQIHVFTHTNENPFRCTQCPKEYKTSAGLRYHTRQHYSKTLN